MKYEARIVEAIRKGEIRKVVVIDDAFDPPTIDDEDAGPLLEFLESEQSEKLLKRARISPEETGQAIQAITDSDYQNDVLREVIAKLYRRFVDKFDEQYDPSGRFTVIKGDNLRKVRPLLRLLGKCTGLSVTRVGSHDAAADLAKLEPEVIFVDYFLDASLAAVGEPGARSGERARQASLRILRQVLDSQKDLGPSVMLMSSHGVRREADRFRQEIRKQRKVFASRFQFLAKDDLEEGEEGSIVVAPAAADALLDIAQRHRFAGALEDALTHWRNGVDEAVNQLWETVTDLELQDYAYLARFRLAEEGQPLSSYLEWFFGELLVDQIARCVDWKQKSFTVIDEGALKNKPGSDIEGAFDGPTERIADLFYRARVDERPSRQGKDLRTGDIYVRKSKPDELLALVTPDCDIIKRGNKRAARRATLIAGTLQPINAPDGSVSDFFRRGRKSYNVKWDIKDIRTIEFEEIESAADVKLVGTLRPLYAYELQQRVLSDLGRIGLAVAPAMAVMATAEAVVRGKDGPVRFALSKEGVASCAVIPKRGGTDKPRTLYHRRVAAELLDRLTAMGDDVSEDARADALKLRAADAQNKFVEKLCRDGQKDGEEAFGILTTLGPERTGKSAPWCQILVRFEIAEPIEAEQAPSAATNA